MRPTGQSPKPNSRRGWRGARTEVREPAKYNWQRDASDHATAVSARPVRRLRWRLAAYGIAGTLLLAAFVKSLLFVPPKTPFVLVAPSLVTPYEAPLPPDAWIAEDADRFRMLDDAGAHSAGILRLHDGSRDWHSTTQGLEGLRRQLRDLADRGDQTDAVVIYVSMHGAVDDDGNPCLILPSSAGLAAVETSSWVPVTKLLDAIRDAGFREDTLKLLVLDSSRFRVNWSLGTIYNAFSKRLQDVLNLESADVPNLAVLNSVSPGERSWASAELQGSVFAWFLQRGLSGDADDRESGGNGDRQVSLDELDRYVSNHVREWVWRNRREQQNPLLIRSKTVPAAATVSWSLRTAERIPTRQLLPETSSDAEAKREAEQQADRARFWLEYARLHESGAETTDPLTWARLQQSLVRFEQCLAAGRAYKVAAIEADNAVEALLRRFDGLVPPPNGAKSECLVGARRHELDVLEMLPATSLPLAAAFGCAKTRDLQAISSALDALSTSANEPALRATLNDLQSIGCAQQLTEVQFIRLLLHNRIPERYVDSQAASAALQLRMTAEAAAVPCDERLLPRLRTSIDEIDADRRALEDRLFAGRPFDDKVWDNVRQRYLERFHVAEQTSSALRWRDQVLAELPWLAQWLTRLALETDNHDHEQLDGEIAGNLRALLRTVCRTTADEFLQHGATDDLRSDYEALRKRIDEQYDRLLNIKEADGDGAAVRDALSLLELPLLPARNPASRLSPVDEREALRQRVTTWASQLATGNSEAEPPSESDAERGSRFLARIESSWQYDPAIEVFADAEQPAKYANERDPTLRLVPREQKIRHRLATLSDQWKVARSTALAAANPTEARADWSDDERTARALAALLVVPLDDDPVLELRKLDLEQLLAWQAERALEDFYGSADTEQPPYFAVAAGHCLTAAKKLVGAGQATRDELTAIEQLLEQRRTLVTASPHHKLVVTRAADVVIIDEQLPASTTVVLGPHAGRDTVTLPAGLAALYVDHAPDSQEAIREIQVPLAQRVQQEVPILEELVRALPAGTVGTHAAILAFRGHRFVSPFEIAHLNGPQSKYLPSRSDAADILVIGPQQRAPDVMIVLDCSASMQRPLTLEDGQLRRFDAALLALRSILEDLARQGNMHVGFTLFGHRARWDHDHLGEVLQQTAYARPISPNQMPYDDVETVLPIGRFDPTIAGQLFQTLQTAEPWGESPLFLALIEAIRQFPATAQPPSQSIILITDGLNSQFNAPRDKRKYLPDVIQALSARPVRIDVVGFGIEQAEAAEAQQAYHQLVNSSNGSYAPVEETTELVDHLRGLMTRETFSVHDGGQFLATATVGSQLHVDQLAARVQPLTVSSASAAVDVSVEGGESVRLQLSPDGTQLTVEPYLAGNPQFFPLTGEAGAQWLDLNLVVHQPLRKQANVEFELSLQDRNGRFVPRPTTVWAEITPVMSDASRDAGYTFYDRQFQPDVGVPVLRCSADDWPTDATQAEIQFFCRFDAPDSVPTVPVTGQQTSGDSGFLTLPGPAAATLTIEHRPGEPAGAPAEVRIVEQYESLPPEFPAFRVELAQGIGLIEVVRRFDAQHRVCLHRFRLADGDASQLQSDSLRITRRDREKVGAWQLSAPVRVNIADDDGLIVLPQEQATVTGPALRPAD